MPGKIRGAQSVLEGSGRSFVLSCFYIVIRDPSHAFILDARYGHGSGPATNLRNPARGLCARTGAERPSLTVLKMKRRRELALLRLEAHT